LCGSTGELYWQLGRLLSVYLWWRNSNVLDFTECQFDRNALFE